MVWELITAFQYVKREKSAIAWMQKDGRLHLLRMSFREPPQVKIQSMIQRAVKDPNIYRNTEFKCVDMPTFKDLKRLNFIFGETKASLKGWIKRKLLFA